MYSNTKGVTFNLADPGVVKLTDSGNPCQSVYISKCGRFSELWGGVKKNTRIKKLKERT